ncbi:DUF2341 domain-containing protein [Zavarzinella formosa]|uniref:DUF2341 domain-containing protein n=1 Tax=Zavarzinella formosa TaxID=360055 RepID=UPI0002E96C9B|nr:DUF2341 domain-containing protein [Zavarzinella formosa]
MKTRFSAPLLLLALFTGLAVGEEPGWRHSGSLYLLTTPEGANLAASASVNEFPVLVRLHKDFFNFSQAKANGEDIRFSTADGKPLPYEIDEWNPAEGTAAIWVRVPRIRGNERQELKMRWGKADAKSESNATAVFNESNGYVSVWHMGGRVQDVAGTLESKDTGTTPSPGIVGGGRNFPGQKGIFGGDKIPNYPSAASSHSTEAWFRAEKPNSTIIGWGNEGGGRGSKVRMQFRSPPHVHVDSDFSDVDAPGRLPLGEWIHVVHTYDREDGKIYINGRLDGSAKPLLNIKTPARLWIGGWYNNYDFVGDIDEVRISKVARPADWIKLQFENQKPMQTLVGPLVQPGNEFSIPETEVAVPEGKSITITAKAGGAEKIYWIVKRDGKETVAATDRFSFTFDAGRVVGSQSAILQFKAVYANEVKTKDIPVTIREDIPEPVFTLKAPTEWDGRQPIEVVPQIANLDEMRAKGADKLFYSWKADGIAVIKETLPEKLLLKRSQNSGKLTVSVAIHNGGQETIHSTIINVKEPVKDDWISRLPGKDEKPEEGQFYARDDKNEGMLIYNGVLPEQAESAFLNLYADDKLINTLDQKPGKDNAYSFAVKLKPGLVKYRVEFGTKTGNNTKVLHSVGNLVCGDAYIITGQSNAVATDFGKEDPAYRSEWIRTFGSMSGSPKGVSGWGNAIHRSRDAEKLQIGYWGMELAKRLVESQKVPVFIINGAVGGTRIDQHQRNQADPEDMTTIYGRLLWRVRQAKLTHGIRGLFWHQGENDQGADGPTGGFGWETYRSLFIELAASWKQDFPNIQHYYIFQIWPRSCAMGINGSDNRLREVQRNLPSAFSRMSIMSTLGIDPPGGCHFPAAGYAEFARLITPLVERDNYGKIATMSITPPNLKRAFFNDDKKDEIVLEFDQPVKWDNTLTGQFYLDGEKGKIASGTGLGNRVTLKLSGGSSARNITYLDSKAWSQATLLRGENGLAALTFCEVPLQGAKPAR